MATINFYTNYLTQFLPLELVLMPTEVQESATETIFKLPDATTLTLKGAFSGKAESRTGRIQELEYQNSSGKLFSVSSLELSFDEFMQYAANVSPAFINQGNDQVIGTWGNDVLYSGAGNDVLHGLSGNDRLYGEAGDDVLIGLWDDDFLSGGAGSDVLDGGQGIDIMLGGTGDDTYIVDNVNDLVIEYWRQGIDTVETSLNLYELGAYTENLVATAGGDFRGTGNWKNNDIRGSLGNDVLSGRGGDDIINGGNGNDKIFGEGGDDRLFGDAGGDLITTESSIQLPSGTPVSLTLTMPEVSSTADATVSGYITNAKNQGDSFNLAFVLDVSGSMSSGYRGDVEVGDLNGDGRANTLLDGAISSFNQLIASVQNSGLSDKVNIALIPFDSSATISKVGKITDDANGNGVSDLIDAAAELRDGGGTSYDLALQRAIEFFGKADAGSNHMFFISDGAPGSANYYDELETLASEQGGSVNIRSIALGDGADYATLDLLDDQKLNNSAFLVANPDELEAGLTQGGYQGSDIASVDIYKNGQLVDTLGSDALVQTPFGLRYSSTIEGIASNSQDKVEVKINFADASIQPLSVSQLISSGEFQSIDQIWGGDGDDYIDGGAGADILYGNLGNDTFRVSEWNEKVIENADEGIDTVESDVAFSLTNANNVENLTLLGNEGHYGQGNKLDNVIYGNNGDNMLLGLEGDDYIDGAGGVDTVSFVRSSQGVTVDLANGVAEGEGSDTLINIENVLGSQHNDNLTGDAFDNRLDGQGGDDILYGLNGDDTLVGSRGDDQLNGGFGSDTADYSGSARAISLVGSASRSTVTGLGTDQLSSVENIIGTQFDDSITFTSFYSNVIDAGAGDDSIDAGRGDDFIYAGWGNDTINGGSGIDTLSFEKATGEIGIFLSTHYASGMGVDTVTNIENVIGSQQSDRIFGDVADNHLTGGLGNDTLSGQEGNDILDGGEGSDTLYGGVGDDTFIVDNVNDQVIEYDNNGLGGDDTVQSSVSYALSNYVENLELTGTRHIDGAGNTLNNTITGNAGDNALRGVAGNNTIFGGIGNDFINGGSGDDVLDGGEGIDTLVFDLDTGVTVNLFSRTSSGQGSDQIRYFENVHATNKADNIVGDSGANEIYAFGNNDIIDAGYGNDYIDAGWGNDNIQGGNGNDTIVSGWGNDSIDGGSGFDTLDYSAINSAVVVNLHAGTAVGQGSESITGIEGVRGTAQADTIVWHEDPALNTTNTQFVFEGGAGDDTLITSSGTDVLDGGAGADIMMGGEGNDTYYVDNAQDEVIEVAATYGTDTVISSVGYTLADNVENLVLSASVWRADGNERDNVIRGFDNNNGLNGFAGRDTLIGGGGRDWLTGGADRDTFKYESVSDSDVASGGDVITDFNQAEMDVIDLSDIDAIVNNSSTFDRFTFIEQRDFTSAGQLRFEVNEEGTETTLLGNVDGDLDADFMITLQGISSVSTSDLYM